MSNSLISIIIPVYNANNFISKCIESLINQTYKNIEIILIDDCSTDDSCAVIRSYVEKDNRVKLYSTGTNGGPGKARNVGLENSHGEYIMFCDNDDTYEPNMCEVMLNTMIEKDVDLVTCKSNVINSELDRELSNFVNNNRIGYVDCRIQKYFDANMLVWNKIFKKSIIDKYNIKFTTISAEDDLFIAMYDSVIDTYFGLNKKLHNLLLHKSSYTQTIARGKDTKMKLDRLYVVKFYIDFLIKYDLLDKRYSSLKSMARGELLYIFRYYKFSLFEFISFLYKYTSFTKKVNYNNEMSFYNLYLKFKMPWFFIKIFKMCYWS